MTDETLKRIFAAYDTSYRNLVKNLREAFPRLEQAGSISTLVRQGAIAAELGEALKFINPEAAKELERLGMDTIQQAGDLGQQMAGDALKYVGVQSTFTTVPVGAVRNQAERFRERLVNYSDQQASSISAVVEQGLIQGWGTRKIEGQLRGLGVSFKSNAETVARTETLSAYNGAARSRYEQAGVAYIQWIATPAEGTCSLCYARNTKVWKITEAPSIPAHPRCLPGDTLIFSPTIQGSASRQYTGQIVTIQTTSGKKLTATPNHPVFTDNGWIPLNQITEGDYVFSSIGAEDAVRLISPDNYQRPALISEVVRSFRESTGVGSVSMKVSPEYFHGDGEGSDVCVVSTNGLLRNDGYTETLEPFSHQHFIRRLVRALELLSPGLSAFLSPRQRPSLHSLMSVFNLPSPGGRIHSAPLNSLSLRLASDVHTSISQYQPDSGSLDAICLCESVFGLPLNISDNNQVPYISIGSTNSGFTGPVFEKLNLLLSALYSPPLNFAKQPLTVQPELSSSSLNRLSGKVKRDRVVNVRVSHFEGTVYNIETQTGWYFANSILTHNCRCTTLPVSSLDQIDTAFYESYSQDGLDDLARQKLQPDNGLTYWEKKAGATLAKPAWVPGQVIPKAEPVKAKSRRIPEFPTKAQSTKLEVVRELGGSTGAQLVKDKNGQLFVRKRSKKGDVDSRLHLRNEFAADEMYRALGVNVPKGKLYETADGVIKLTKYIDDATPLSSLAGPARASVVTKLQENFAIDAILGNWDVIGLTEDNILVDKSGKVWRIDNGGSLQFRAQGERKKGDQWNEYPTELWSMRDRSRSNAATKVFSALDHFDVVSQVEALAKRRKVLLKSTPDSLKDLISRRLDEAERMAATSRTLQDDKWKADYIGLFTRHSMGLRNSGIVDKLPNRLDLDKNNILFDENNERFDNLRGSPFKPGSLIEDLVEYINQNGGNYNKVIPSWAAEQAGDSWNDEPQAYKWQIALNRDVPLDQYFWRHGVNTARQHWETYTAASGQDVYQNTFAMFHAWNYELLQKVDMPNNDKKAGTFRVVRTEKGSRIKNTYGLSPGDRNVTMLRGAVESTSMFSRVDIFGTEVTVQSVPHHRVLGMYLYGRAPLNEIMFAGDYENELVALLEGVPFDYLRKGEWRNTKPNYSP